MVPDDIKCHSAAIVDNVQTSLLVAVSMGLSPYMVGFSGPVSLLFTLVNFAQTHNYSGVSLRILSPL